MINIGVLWMPSTITFKNVLINVAGNTLVDDEDNFRFKSKCDSSTSLDLST